MRCGVPLGMPETFGPVIAGATCGREPGHRGPHRPEYPHPVPVRDCPWCDGTGFDLGASERGIEKACPRCDAGRLRR